MILLADSDGAFRERVAEQLGRPHGLVEAEGVTELEAVLAERAGEVSVLLLGPNLPPAEALQLASRLQRTAPDVSVVVVASTLSSDLLQEALRSGVRDVLPASFTPQQLADTVARASQLSQQMRDLSGMPQESTEDQAHKVITVFSSKGGVGKSFVASNLGILLAQRSGKDVAMVDLDLQFGDLAIMLQLFPARTIYDAAQNLDRLDADALRAHLTPHRSLVFLLAAPLEPGLAETISSEAAQRIIHMLKETFAYVVVDTPPSFTDHVLAALDESDEAVLITTMDVPSIKNLKLSLQTLDMLGVSRDRVRLVLNRADSKVGLRLQEVEKTLRTKVDVAVPSSREVPLSINRGTPLVLEDPKSPVSASLVKLAELVGPTAGAAAPADTKGGRFRLRRR